METPERVSAFPLGATVRREGVNFSVYSKDADGVDLLLFEGEEDAAPSRVIALEPGRHRTGHYWHVFVPGVASGQLYGYRVRGPFDPERGMRFAADKVLLDPYGRSVAVPAGYSRAAASEVGDNGATAMKSVALEARGYDWGGDRAPRHPFSRTVIYEMHVAGFTRHPNSGVEESKRGTYAAVVEKIPYLEELGVTAVELLPVFQFDAQDAPPGRSNYWGYTPVSFFAPHRAYSFRKDPLGPVEEFRDMVKALHRAGIEVILDVVYNHTAEGDQHGPTICFRGLQNDAYYILEKDRSRYANYSGTGNTLNANHPVVRRMIVDSLRYWVTEMHVDGFRFDLASILSRDEDGIPLENPPVLLDIETDPVLAGVKLIAEAWDAAGLYQVGSFVGDFWKEWNGRFRDDVRRFLRGDRGTVRALASRLLASPDLYAHKGREPEQSVNFVTCHDGFTLNDLVSYERKRNEENGENNADGTDASFSWNCGEEGPTENPAVEKLRNRQVRNFLSLTVLAMGTPMILMGDEVRRTQGGNNNAYCQDNKTSWFDWELVERNRDLHRFVRTLIACRCGREFSAGEPGLTLNEQLSRGRIRWHGVRLGEPDWSEGSRSIACSAVDRDERPLLHLMINAWREPLLFDLPPLSGGSWHLLMDTAGDPPGDIADPGRPGPVEGFRFLVQPFSVVFLAARGGAAERGEAGDKG